VIDLGGEADFGWLKGVVGWEGDGQEENASSIWRVSLGNTRYNEHIQFHQSLIGSELLDKNDLPDP